MKIHGMVNKFFVVTKPSPVSELADICFSCTYEQFMLQVRGGLKEEDIVGIFIDDAEAKRMAMKLVGKAIIRTSDAILVDVLVNIQVVPTNRNMTAGVLAGAAVEAVGNAVRKAEEEGFRHGLGDQVSMGMGEVRLQNHLTLFG
jgi:hypothetical protein